MSESYLRAFAGEVAVPHVQVVVPAADADVAALVDGDDVDSESHPVIFHVAR